MNKNYSQTFSFSQAFTKVHLVLTKFDSNVLLKVCIAQLLPTHQAKLLDFFEFFHPHLTIQIFFNSEHEALANLEVLKRDNKHLFNPYF